MSRTDNLRIRRARALIAPAILEEEIPLSRAAARFVRNVRGQVADIVHGRNRRLLVIVGPCSVHDVTAVLDYARRLQPVADALAGEMLVLMRVYFEKPRTTVGWKGYLSDPHLDGSYQVNAGLRGARRLLADIAALGLPAATEFFDTTFGQYYTDLIAWGAIGARTVESQVHRQLASGLSMPVGIKNATNGGVDVAIDALVAARHPHLFPSLTKEGAPALLETTGNEDCHLVLRGGGGPNYGPDAVAGALARLRERDIDTGVMVDCSHGNSDKDPARQIAVADAVAAQRRDGQTRLMGIMLESHLVGGRQDAAHTYGQSITDACLGWADTERLLRRLAEAGVA